MKTLLLSLLLLASVAEATPNPKKCAWFEDVNSSVLYFSHIKKYLETTPIGKACFELSSNTSSNFRVSWTFFKGTEVLANDGSWSTEPGRDSFQSWQELHKVLGDLIIQQEESQGFCGIITTDIASGNYPELKAVQYGSFQELNEKIDQMEVNYKSLRTLIDREAKHEGCELIQW